MEIHTLATFEGFYERVGTIVAGDGLHTVEGRAAFDRLSAEYGLINHWDLVPELIERYGVGRG
jgi:hypothetical protein